MRNSFFGHTLARSSTATDLQIQKTKTSAQYSEYIRNLANSIERIYSQFSRFNSEYLINLQFHRRVRQSMYFLLHCCVGILKPVYVQDHLFVMISEHNATTSVQGSAHVASFGIYSGEVALRKKTIMAHIREHACGSHVAPEQRTMTLDARAVGQCRKIRGHKTNDWTPQLVTHNEVLQLVEHVQYFGEISGFTLRNCNKEKVEGASETRGGYS